MNARTIFVLASALTIAACDHVTEPLFFGQTETVGITINGGATTQSAELTLGYRDYDVAVIPISIDQKDGSHTQLQATVGAGNTDTMSVIGQFQVNAKASTPEVGLGKFFATGLAARYIAEGFEGKLAGGVTESKSNIAIAANGTTVTFSKTFTAAPTVQVTVVGSTALYASAANITTTTCVIHVWDHNGTDVGGAVNWTATGG